jgi:uncharacterized coiled-coil protein SlyX
MTTETEKQAAREADRMEQRLDELSQDIDDARSKAQAQPHGEEKPPSGNPPDTEAHHPDDS